MTVETVWTVQRFGWWDAEKRKLQKRLASGAVLNPWFDHSIVTSQRKEAITEMLAEYAFMLRDIPDETKATMTRAQEIRWLRQRGVRVVRAAIAELGRPAGLNGHCAFDGVRGKHYHVITVRKNGIGIVSFPIRFKKDLAKLSPRLLLTAPKAKGGTIEPVRR